MMSQKLTIQVLNHIQNRSKKYSQTYTYRLWLFTRFLGEWMLNELHRMNSNEIQLTKPVGSAGTQIAFPQEFKDQYPAGTDTALVFVPALFCTGCH